MTSPAPAVTEAERDDSRDIDAGSIRITECVPGVGRWNMTAISAGDWQPDVYQFEVRGRGTIHVTAPYLSKARRSAEAWFTRSKPLLSGHWRSYFGPDCPRVWSWWEDIKPVALPAESLKPEVDVTEAKVETGARALARLQMERNARIDGEAMDDERLIRCIDIAWRDWVEESRRVLEAVAARALVMSAPLPPLIVRAPPPRPGSRFDLDRMGEAIRALPGSPVVGRAIGDGR